jgi:hypothetical protein
MSQSKGHWLQDDFGGCKLDEFHKKSQNPCFTTTRRLSGEKTS